MDEIVDICWRMLRMPLIRFAASLFAAAGIQLAAPALAAQSLESVLDIVYATNPEIRAERERQEATAEAPKQARAGVLPQISADASYGSRSNDQIVNSELFGQVVDENREFDLDPAIATVSAQQTIFQGFRNINRIRQARARVRSGQAQLRLIEQKVLLDAATAYFDVQRDTEIFAANKSNVSVLMKNLSDAELLLQANDITQTDVDQARARLSRAQADLSTAQARLAVSRAGFQRIVGDAPGTLEPMAGPPELPATEEDAQAAALELSPVIQRAREQEESSRRQVAIEKSSFSPSIFFDVRYQYADEPNSFIDRDEEFSYGVRASIPIFSGGTRLSKTREAAALYRSDKERLIAAERNVRADVSAAWSEIIAAQARIAAAERQVHANDSALSGVRREAEANVRTALDVLNAEQELLDSKVVLVSAHRDRQVASYKLLAVIGAPVGIEAAKESVESRGSVAPESESRPAVSLPDQDENKPRNKSEPTPLASPVDNGGDKEDEVFASSTTANEAPHDAAEPPGFAVQFASFLTAADADRFIESLTRSRSDFVAGLIDASALGVSEAAVNGATYHRVRFGPVPLNEAKAICEEITIDCLVVNAK